MPKYMTKQRKELLNFFEAHIDEALCAKQIAEELSDKNISVSSVYRNLSDLEKEGKVRRVSQKGSREVFYQYIASHSCKDCLHLSCEKCGKTFHMKTTGAENLIKTVANDEEFTIDKSNTVLYGICKDCRNGGQE